MANHVGALIKSARTAAGFTQEQLAERIDGITAGDISKAERGEKELPQTVLKQIAKLTGVTQASLIEAAKISDYTGGAGAKKKPAASAASTGKKSAASSTSAGKKSASSASAAKKKPVAASASAGKKSASSASAGKTTTASAGKKSSAASADTDKKTAASASSAAGGMQLTAAEKQLVELYRKASSDVKKQAVSVLKGETGPGLMDVLGTILGNAIK